MENFNIEKGRIPREYRAMVKALAKPGDVLATEIDNTQLYAMALAADLALNSATLFKRATDAAKLALFGQDVTTPTAARAANKLHMAGALFGEVGELYDTLKKWIVYRKPLDLVNIYEEVGDLLFYITALYDDDIVTDLYVMEHRILCGVQQDLERLCVLLNVDLPRAMDQNREKLRARYGEHDD